MLYFQRFRCFQNQNGPFHPPMGPSPGVFMPWFCTPGLAEGRTPVPADSSWGTGWFGTQPRPCQWLSLLGAAQLRVCLAVSSLQLRTNVRSAWNLLSTAPVPQCQLSQGAALCTWLLVKSSKELGNGQGMCTKLSPSLDPD